MTVTELSLKSCSTLFEDHLPNLLTVAKHSAFSTNHLTDIDKNYNQELYKHLN